jgi:hypothetical protein
MEANIKIFGDLYKPNGFFPTELAYAPKVLRVVEKLKFNYLLVDEISLNRKLGMVDQEKYYTGRDGLRLIPVNRNWSSELRGNHDLTEESLFWLMKKQFCDESMVLITANDAELFGHHMRNRLSWLRTAVRDKQIAFLTIKEYLEMKNVRKTVGKLFDGTWETGEADLAGKNPYPLWYDRGNEVQMKQWELAWMGISVFARYVQPEDDEGWKWHSARDFLDRGLSSCYWWWASCRPWWNPDMICDGAEQLIKAIRSSRAGKSRKLMAEKLYSHLVHLVWQWHWSGEAQKRIDEFEKRVGKGLYWVRTKPVLW